MLYLFTAKDKMDSNMHASPSGRGSILRNGCAIFELFLI